MMNAVTRAIAVTSLILVARELTLTFGADINGECNRTAELETNAIILSQPSINAGAEFLDKLVVSSLRECYSACCKQSTCNTAVYKAKPPTYCFLFNCTPAARCSYAPQSGYYVISLTTLRRGFFDEKRSANFGLLESFTQPIAQLGDHCDERHSCSPEHSVCSKGLCVCHRGWLKRGTQCVPFVCQSEELQYQCNDSVTCIAIYDRCNGVIECPDGSDESNCPTASSDITNKALKISDTALNNGIENGSQYLTPSTSAASSLLLNPVSGRRNNAHHTEPLLSRHLTDADVLLNLPYAAPHRSGSGQLSSVSPFSIRTRSTSIRPEDYPVRRTILTPNSIAEDWYAPDPEWEIGRDDQFSEFDPHDPTSSSSRHHIPSYGRELRSHYDRDSLRRRALDSWKAREYFTPSVLTRSDAYDSPVNKGYRIRSYYPTAVMPEELVDPSVFRDVPSATMWNRLDRTSVHKHALAGRAKLINEETSASAASHPETGQRSVQTTSPSAPMSNSVGESNEVLSVLERSQSESHTAAMILAFSLGLVCCFVVILIFEWRRRRRLQNWPLRHRPNNVSVLFDERRKPPVIGSRRPQKRTKSFRNAGAYVAVATDPDDDDKLVQDGLVL